MADKTGIEWTDATWPIVQGCDYESPGCTNCYAVPLINRLAHNPNPTISGRLQGLVKKQGSNLLWTGKLALREDRLDWPLKWKTPRQIFVPSHGDIFHPDVPDEFLDQIFARMVMAPQHTYQVLTKRGARMRAYFSDTDALEERLWDAGNAADPERMPDCRGGMPELPLTNVWLGVSVESQRLAAERIPHLLATSAAKRFISAEPLLGRIDLMGLVDVPAAATITDALQGYRAHNCGPDEDGKVMWDNDEPCARLDWVICGGDSGPKARPMHPDWVRQLRDQCDMHGVPFFFKQWGTWGPDEGPSDGRDRIMDGRAGCAWFDGNVWHYEASGFDVPLDASDGCGQWVYRLGKSATGNLLDGRTHLAFPATERI